jgi:hypothetical protein
VDLSSTDRCRGRRRGSRCNGCGGLCVGGAGACGEERARGVGDPVRGLKSAGLELLLGFWRDTLGGACASEGTLPQM